MNMPTQRIQETLGLDLSPEKQDSYWQMFDDGGVEVEVGEFLYGMVRMNKPQRVLETGLYSGISAMYMGLGLEDNGSGVLDSLEYERVHIRRAKERIVKLGLSSIVAIYQTASLDFSPGESYDMILLDTEPHIRFQEMVKFLPQLNPGGFLFIHDTPRNLAQGNKNPDHPEFKSWPFGDLPAEIITMVGSSQLYPWHFNNARGLTGFYKPHNDDYKWELV